RNPERHTRLSILITPWGEALTRRWYRDALVALSHLPHVETVAVQTNLSCRTGWLADADPSRIALWRSEEHTSELHSRENLVCRPWRPIPLPYTPLFRSPKPGAAHQVVDTDHSVG